MNVNFQNATALGSFSAKALEPVTEEGMKKSKLLFYMLWQLFTLNAVA